jgi:hypothetical protein
MGLAALPLGDVAAIRFWAPLMITVLSVLFLPKKCVFEAGWPTHRLCGDATRRPPRHGDI